MRINLQNIDNNLYKAITENNKEKESNYLKSVEKEVQSFDDNFTFLKETFSNNNELINGLSKTIEASSISRKQIIDFINREDKSSAMAIIENTYSDNVDNSAKLVNEI